jgi:hypothetical protein
MTYAAQQTLHAVDQTSLERWFTDTRLRRYLDAQLAQAGRGEVVVERLRVVRKTDLEQPRYRNLLRAFIELHEQAGASLIVCHEDDLRGLNTIFLRGANAHPGDRTILVLIDSESAPAGVISELDDHGYVKRSSLYLRSTAQIRRCQRDFKAVAQYLEREGGRDVRALLADHHDPPLPETPSTEESPSPWPLGPSML